MNRNDQTLSPSGQGMNGSSSAHIYQILWGAQVRDPAGVDSNFLSVVRTAIFNGTVKGLYTVSAKTDQY